MLCSVPFRLVSFPSLRLYADMVYCVRFMSTSPRWALAVFRISNKKQLRKTERHYKKVAGAPLIIRMKIMQMQI